MRALVSVGYARVITEELRITVSAKSGAHHILIDVALDEDVGVHPESRLHVRIVGNAEELFDLKNRIRRGSIVSFTGRLIGDRSIYMSCWARNVRNEE